jgi:glycerol-3-phosphate acyltransferase PlsY
VHTIDWLLVVSAYILGSVPSGYLWSRLLKGVDVTATGSGSVGGMNVVRNVGPLPGLLTGLTDVGKGTLAVYLAAAYGTTAYTPLLAAPAAVLGHNYMIFLRFRGGKGLGTTVGALLVLSPASILYAAAAVVACSLALRDTNTGTGMAALLFWAVFWLQYRTPEWALFGLALGLIIFAKHLGDVRSYLKGRRQLV